MLRHNFILKLKSIKLYENSEYIWEDVEVIDFNDQTQKYIVKQYPDGLIKKVNRF